MTDARTQDDVAAFMRVVTMLRDRERRIQPEPRRIWWRDGTEDRGQDRAYPDPYGPDRVVFGRVPRAEHRTAEPGTVLTCRRCEVQWRRETGGDACWVCGRPGKLPGEQ